MATLVFKKATRIIELSSPQTEVTIQDLVNQIRTYEGDILNNIDIPKMMTATGKDSLGGGVLTGITLRLHDGWRISAEPRAGPNYVRVNIRGGNLVTSEALGVDPNDPVAPSAFVTISLTSSSSATLQEAQTIENIQHLLESKHSSSANGNVYYWDPDMGNDSFDGLSESTPVLTFTRAHDLVVSGNEDAILIESHSTGGTTIITEKITISKDNVHLRGQGRSIIFRPTNSTADTITVTGDDVELSNFQVETFSTGGKNAVRTTGDRTIMEHLYVFNASGSGLKLENNDGCKVLHCNFIENQGNSIFGHNSGNMIIDYCDIAQSGLNGIKFTSTARELCAHNRIKNTIIHEHENYGMDVGQYVWDAFIEMDTFLEPIGLGRILDNGDVTVDEDQAHHMRSAVNTKRSIESLRDDHSGFGETYYWDPFGGDDIETGITFQRAVKTFARIIQVVTTNHNDIVIILSTNPAGVTVITERININKNFVFFRGAGRNIFFNPLTATDGTPIITISGEGVELSGVRVKGSTTGSDDSIVVTGDFALIQGCWIEGARGEGIKFNGSNHSKVEKCIVSSSIDDGIHFQDSSFGFSTDNTLSQNGGAGVHISSPTPAQTIGNSIKNTVIAGSVLHNIKIDSGVIGTLIDDDTVALSDGGGRILNNGTSTVDREVANRVYNLPTGGRRSLDR